MAIVNKVTPETIERLRGKVDFYMLRGILPVARRWPKKPKPPYTALQAEGMAVFGIANGSMHRLSDNILEVWRSTTVGIKPSWTDVYRSIIMKYWKKYRIIPPIALDYERTENETEYLVKWRVLQLFIDKDTPETIRDLTNAIIPKVDIAKAPKPLYYTLYDNDKNRLVAPFILFEAAP